MKIITVLLSAFSFALFALASTAYTYSERNYILNNYLYDLQQNPQLVFYDYESADKDSLQPEDIELIKETLPLDYLYTFACEIDYAHFVGKYFTTRWEQWSKKKFPSVERVVAGTEELFQKAGYELLEGRYPTAENEIAIDAKVFNAFAWGGYSDNFDNFSSSSYDNTKESHGAVEINDYADVIGKRLVAWEGIEPLATLPGHYGDFAKEVVIVGVYEIPDPSSGWLVRKQLTESAVIRSQAWQEVREQRNCYIQAMFMPDVSDFLNKNFVEKCLEVTETIIARFIEQHGEKDSSSHYDLGAMGMAGYFDNVDGSNLDLLVEIFVGAGGIFLIFSVILLAYFITAIMSTKSKQIGLLRAFGTPKRKITEIFIIGILFLAVLIFIVSLILTAWAYYGVLKPWMLDGEGGIPPMIFNGWTVLILFGVSLIVPVLSVLLPIGNIFKSTIVDNMKGISTKKKKGGRHVRSK